MTSFPTSNGNKQQRQQLTKDLRLKCPRGAPHSPRGGLAPEEERGGPIGFSLESVAPISLARGAIIPRFACEEAAASEMRVWWWFDMKMEQRHAVVLLVRVGRVWVLLVLTDTLSPSNTVAFLLVLH